MFRKTILFFALSLLLNRDIFTEDFLRLLTPKNGWSSERIVTISGETSVPDPWIKIVYNGVSFVVPVANGAFSRRYVAASGVNIVYTEAVTQDNVLSDSVTFYSKAPQVKLRIVSVWDTEGTYVDLWVTEPNGELCKWNQRETSTGGTLDIGNDYPGYGPQIYTNPAPPKGKDGIQLNYYSDYGNPVSNAKVFVIQNEGSSNEIFREFEAMLTKGGTMIEVESITVE